MRRIERPTVRSSSALRDSLARSFVAYGIEIDTENNRHRVYWRRDNGSIEYHGWMYGMPDLSDGSTLRELNRGRWYRDEPTKWDRMAFTKFRGLFSGGASKEKSAAERIRLLRD